MKISRPARVTSLLLVVALASACRTQPPDPTTGAPSQKATSIPSASAAAPASAASSGPAPASDAGAMAATSAPAPAEEVLAGTLFTKEVQAAFRVAACGGDDSFIPAGVDRKMVDNHCGMLTSGYAEYKKEWIDVAGPFLAKLRPANLPPQVVYPFGGGDT